MNKQKFIIHVCCYVTEDDTAQTGIELTLRSTRYIKN